MISIFSSTLGAVNKAILHTFASLNVCVLFSLIMRHQVSFDGAKHFGSAAQKDVHVTQS